MFSFKYTEAVHGYNIHTAICSPIQYQKISDKYDLDYNYKTDDGFAYTFIKDEGIYIWLSCYDLGIIVHEAHHAFTYLAEHFSYDYGYKGEFVAYHSQYWVDELVKRYKRKKSFIKKTNK